MKEQEATKVKQEVDCGTPGCWQVAVCSGYCGACYSAMRRLSKQTFSYLTTYLQRVGRFSARGNIALKVARKPVQRRRAA